jgi:hypothetical protein
MQRETVQLFYDRHPSLIVPWADIHWDYERQSNIVEVTVNVYKSITFYGGL